MTLRDLFPLHKKTTLRFKSTLSRTVFIKTSYVYVQTLNKELIDPRGLRERTEYSCHPWPVNSLRTLRATTNWAKPQTLTLDKSYFYSQVFLNRHYFVRDFFWWFTVLYCKSKTMVINLWLIWPIRTRRTTWAWCQARENTCKAIQDWFLLVLFPIGPNAGCSSHWSDRPTELLCSEEFPRLTKQ